MTAPLFLAAVAVLLPDGSPAAGAQAASLAQEHIVHVVGFERPDGQFEQTGGGGWVS